MQLTPPTFVKQIVVVSSWSIPCFPLSISGNNWHPEEMDCRCSLFKVKLVCKSHKILTFLLKTPQLLSIISLHRSRSLPTLSSFLVGWSSFQQTHTWALLASREEHWLLVTSSMRGAGAARRAVSGAFFLQTAHPQGQCNAQALPEGITSNSLPLFNAAASSVFWNLFKWCLSLDAVPQKDSQGKRQECEEFQEVGEIVMCHSHRLRLLSAAFSEQQGCILY